MAAVLLMPAIASADASLGRALAAPGADAGAELRVTSEEADDEATVDGRPCQTPCTLRLSLGTHTLSLRSGAATNFLLGPRDRIYARARGWNKGELGFGIGLMVAAAGIFIGLTATTNTLCWDFSSGGTCQPEVGPILIGVSVMSMLIGVGLTFDSAASVQITRFVAAP